MIRNSFYKYSIPVMIAVWLVNTAVFAAPRNLPPAVRAVLVKINTMLQKKDYPHAIETLLAFQAKGGPVPETGRPDPRGYHHPEIYYSLGNCYLLQEQYKPAIAAYGHSVARDPNHTYAWLNLAKANDEMVNYAEAGRCFGRGYETDPKKNPKHLYFSAAAYLMADLNLQLGIPVKATPVYESCLQEKPDKKLLQHLVLAYRQLGRPDTALERVDTFQIDPEDADLMLLKGELHYQLEQFDKAAAAYRKAARNKGKHVGRAWLMAGYAAWQMDDIAASKRAFAKAREHARQKKAATAALRQLAQASIQNPQQRKGPYHDGGL